MNQLAFIVLSCARFGPASLLLDDQLGLKRVATEEQGDLSLKDLLEVNPERKGLPPEDGVMGGPSAIVPPLRHSRETIMKAMVKVALSYTAHQAPPPPTRRFAVSRKTEPQQVRQFLRLFRSEWKTEYPSINIKFCAVGVSFAACKALCDVEGIHYDVSDPIAKFETMRASVAKYFFRPDPLVANLAYFARKKYSWMPIGSISQADRARKIKEGFLVLYQFRSSDGSVQNHVGIVRSASAAGIKTVEFNTSDGSPGNGGSVAQKSRDYSSVAGFIATY